MSDLDKPVEILDGHPARVLSPADLLETQAARIERLDARIEELKAEAKLWWDENFKKQTACEQMGKRIAELEATLIKVDRAAYQTGFTAGQKTQAARIAELETALRNLDDMIVDLDAGHKELHQVSRFINTALSGGKNEQP